MAFRASLNDRAANGLFPTVALGSNAMASKGTPSAKLIARARTRGVMTPLIVVMAWGVTMSLMVLFANANSCGSHVE